MKFRRIILITALIASWALAQAQQGGGWNMDPVQRAEKTTVEMTDTLGLSDAQAAKVKEINLKYAQKMKDARDNATEDDREAMRAALQTIRKEQDEALKTVLTEDQWASWEKYREAQRANMGPGRRQGPPPGKEKSKNKE